MATWPPVSQTWYLQHEAQCTHTRVLFAVHTPMPRFLCKRRFEISRDRQKNRAKISVSHPRHRSVGPRGRWTRVGVDTDASRSSHPSGSCHSCGPTCPRRRKEKTHAAARCRGGRLADASTLQLESATGQPVALLICWWLVHARRVPPKNILGSDRWGWICRQLWRKGMRRSRPNGLRFGD
jgi:hypothetical protein